MMRRVFSLCLLLLCLSLIGKCWYWSKDGFNILRTRCAFLPIQESRSLDSETLSALDQSYTYIGRGHQCYAFASDDGMYVIKLARLDQYELPLWLRSIPFPFLEKHREEKKASTKRRMDFIVDSFAIAENELKNETALLYLHLNQTDVFHKSIKIKDRIGRSYRLDLDRALFVLQKKQKLMMPLIEQAIKKGDQDEAKRILEAFLNVIEKRSRKGIFNKDGSFLRNFGFDGEIGVQIDIGSFYRKKGCSDESDFQKSFRETAAHIHNWLAGLDSEMTQWFDHRTEEILSR